MDVVDSFFRQRWLVRAPIGLFRAGLGFLGGGRLLMLEHRGRSSGKRRQVVLEVVDRPSHDVIRVCAGLGPDSQWYQNIVAEPRVLVSVGGLRHARATAMVMPAAEGAAVLREYTDRHPGPWRELEPVLRRWAEPLAEQAGEDDWLRVVPVVELALLP